MSRLCSLLTALLFTQLVSINTARSQNITYSDLSFNTDTSAIGVTISPESFNGGMVYSPWELIQGKLAGILISSESGQPGTDFSVQNMRNAGFLDLSTPYIIVDGMPLFSAPLSLNPNDIDNFTYLRDGVSAGIYGGQAANGVLLVNTRKGSDRLAINFSTALSISEVQRRFDIFNADEFREAFMEYWPDRDTSYYFRGVSTDWQDQVFRKAIGQDYYLSVSGSLLQIPVRVSFGKTIQEGVVRKTASERSTASLNLSPSFLDDHLKFNINLNGVSSDIARADYNVVRNTFMANPTYPVYTDDNNQDFYYPGYNQNPVAHIEKSSYLEDCVRWTWSMTMDYRFHLIPGLRVSAVTGRDYYNPCESVTIDSTAPWSMHGLGYTEMSEDTIKSGFYDIRLIWSGRIKALDATYGLSTGMSCFSANNASYSFTGTQEIADYWSYSRYTTEYPQNAVFGDASLSLKGKYSFLVSLRKDSYYRYNHDDKSALFPAVRFTWNAAKEPILQNKNIISDLTLYAGYSISGNFSDISEWETPVFYNLRQEKTGSLNAGVVFGFFNNRIYGSLDFYHKKAKDRMAIVLLLSDYYFYNLGDIQSSGIDFTLQADIISGKDLSWSLGSNIWLGRNKVTYIQGSAAAYITSSGYISFANNIGEPVRSFWCYKQVYDDSGFPVSYTYADLSGNGTVDEADRYLAGTPYPTSIIGLNSHLRYRNWNLDFSGRASLGNKMFNTEWLYSNSSEILYNNCGRFTGYLGDARCEPKSDFYIQDASYFRMDYISLSYAFRIKTLGKVWFNAAATMRNAFVITGYRGQDPEVAGGVPDFDYPRARTLSLKLSFGF